MLTFRSCVVNFVRRWHASMKLRAAITARNFGATRHTPQAGDIYNSLARTCSQSENSADILRSGRVIFDMDGDKYWLVAAIHYRGKRVYIRFIGMHRDYDKIDAETV
jgi:hypothetical protein